MLSTSAAADFYRALLTYFRLCNELVCVCELIFKGQFNALIHPLKIDVYVIWHRSNTNER